jgi:hypothetical protein
VKSQLKKSLSEAMAGAQDNAEQARELAAQIASWLPLVAATCENHGVQKGFADAFRAFQAAQVDLIPAEENAAGAFCASWLLLSVFQENGALLPWPDDRTAARIAQQRLEDTFSADVGMVIQNPDFADGADGAFQKASQPDINFKGGVLSDLSWLDHPAILEAFAEAHDSEVGDNTLRAESARGSLAVRPFKDSPRALRKGIVYRRLVTAAARIRRRLKKAA